MEELIVIIDDDEKLNTLLFDYLSRFHFKVKAFTNPVDGLRGIKELRPGLVVLDVMLPGKDGFEVCREIRKDNTVPIIMLTARGEVTDRVVGLELGADDYLAKPFEPRELVARIQSILRRSNEKQKKEIFRYGKLEVDFKKRIANEDGKALDLTTAEFEILSVFLKNPGIVLNRDTILDKVSGIDWEPYNRSIDVLISRLRQKLNDSPKKPKYLKTIWGTGYMFIGEEPTDEG
ncbi:MAG: response regulator transcription factor [Nitrospinota bacterium]|nr:response regulator transcription factor [Nitrospinota bacterium]